MKVPRFQDSRVSRFQGFKVSGFQGSRVSGFLNIFTQVCSSKRLLNCDLKIFNTSLGCLGAGGQHSPRLLTSFGRRSVSRKHINQIKFCLSCRALPCAGWMLGAAARFFFFVLWVVRGG